MFAKEIFNENISLGSEDNAWNKDPENIEQYYRIDFESYHQ